MRAACYTFVWLAAASASFPQGLLPYRVETIAGTGNNVGDSGPAAEALLRSPGGVALDSSGRLYIADTGEQRVRRIDGNGNITTIAGTGARGVDGDDGLATDATLWDPSAIVVAPDGSVLIADGSARIRKVSPDGRISTIAGNGQAGLSGDGGPAKDAGIGIPSGLALDADGNLYISSGIASVVRKVTPDGAISTVAGTGTQGFSGDGGLAVNAQLFAPTGLAISQTGTLLIADYGNLRVREVLADGTIRTVAGGGQLGDGKSATSAFLAYPCAVVSSPQGGLYIGESGSRIRRVDAAGIMTTIASDVAASSGEPPRASLASNSQPCGLVLDSADSLIVSERGAQQIIRLDLSSAPAVPSQVAGRSHDSRASVPAREAQFYLPEGLALSPSGDLVFADAEAQFVYKLDSSGQISVVAGNGVPGFSGDNGSAAAASLTAPDAVALDRSGNLWIADSLNRRIRKVTPANVISTAASGDAADPKNRISIPTEIAVDLAGNVYFLELNQHTVRKLDPAGNVSTFAGTGEAGFSGDGGPAVEAQLNGPSGLALDDQGRLYIADTLNQSIRRVETDGTISTVAGQGRIGADTSASSPDTLLNPVRIAIDSLGNVVIAEQLNQAGAGRIRWADQNGVISTIAGNGTPGLSGDGGLAGVASFGSTTGLAVDPSGIIYVTDTGNRLLRKLSPIVATHLSVAGGDQQTAAIQSTLSQPLAVVAQDDSEIPVPGVQIHFLVVSGSAVLPPDTVQTDQNGVALVQVQLGGVAGLIVVSASAGGVGEVRFSLEALASAAVAPPALADYTISTIAGNATAAEQSGIYFVEPMGLAFDPQGEMYVADSGSNAVRRISPDGQCATLAGGMSPGFCKPSGGQGVLNSPAGVSVGPNGDVYFADRMNHRILKVDGSGNQTIVAGTGVPGFSGDGGSALQAKFTLPSAVLVDATGAILVSDTGNMRVRKISPDGSITTVAGNGQIGGGGDGNFATQVPIVSPAGLAFGANGVFFVADSGTHEVKAVSPDGILKIVAGVGRPPTADEQQQTTTLPVALDTPVGLAVDVDGALYIGERGRVRRMAGDQPPTAIASTVSGNVLWPAMSGGLLYVLDTDLGTVRRVEQDGTLTTIAGSRFQGDGGPALAASLTFADGMVVDGAGVIYFTDRQNHRVRTISPDGTIQTVAGTGQPMSSGDGGPAIQASFDTPSGLALAPDGSLYVAEYRGAKIRRITPDGLINTVAGTGVIGDSGDGGPARAATFRAPSALAINSDGSIFVADYLANSVRKIDPSGVITSVVGSSRTDTSVDPDLRGTGTALNAPSSLALDQQGDVFIADKFNNRILKLFPSGAIARVAGNGQRRAGAEGGLAVETPLNLPSGVAVDPAGNIYISDESNRISKISPSGVVVTIAGRGPAGYGGDGGPGRDATLGDPGAMAVDSGGALYFSDRANRRIRKLAAAQ